MSARTYSIIFLFVALPLLAAASPAGVIESRQGDQCNTGLVQCCNQILEVCLIYFLFVDRPLISLQQGDPLINIIAGLLGVVLGPIDALVGINCSPLSISPIGGNLCSTDPVCCTNNNIVRNGGDLVWIITQLISYYFQGGLISIGCVPVNL